MDTQIWSQTRGRGAGRRGRAVFRAQGQQLCIRLWFHGVVPRFRSRMSTGKKTLAASSKAKSFEVLYI